MTAPRDLLADVAVAVTAAGTRAVVDRAPVEWRNDGQPYVTVTHVSPISPDLTGDGDVLTDTTETQVSLWETRELEDPTRIAAIVAALDRVAIGGRSLRGRVAGTLRLVDPDTDLIQHATTVRYPLAR